jgi:hypothetical protein
LGAELRGVPGRNFDDCSGSLLRFPPQYIEETKPGGVSHRPVERRSAIPRIHLLNADGIVEPDQLISYLEVEIPSLVINFLMGFGYQHPGFSPTVRAFYPPRESLLAHNQDGPRPFEKSRVAYLHTIGGSEKRLKPDIDTNCFIRWGLWFKRHIIAGESDKPLTRRGPADSDRLNIPFYRAGEPKFEFTQVPDSEIPAIKFPTRLLEGEGVIAISSLESGKACFTVAVPNPPEKARKGSVQTFQHILKHLRTHFFVFGECLLNFGKLILLVISRDRAVMPLPGSETLLQGGVIEVPAQKKPALSLVDSLRVGLGLVLKRLFPLHVSIIANTRKGCKPYRASPSVSPALKDGVLDGVFIISCRGKRRIAFYKVTREVPFWPCE